MPAPARYSKQVVELFGSLPGAGGLAAGAPGRVVDGEAAAIDRGAWVRFEARIVGGRIADCAFRAWGCPHTLAAAAWAASALRRAAVQDFPVVEAARLARELDVPPEKMGRMLVVEDALRNLLARARAVE
jgi:NifU-like protein involved in Fe-S cluster formation